MGEGYVVTDKSDNSCLPQKKRADVNTRPLRLKACRLPEGNSCSAREEENTSN